MGRKPSLTSLVRKAAELADGLRAIEVSTTDEPDANGDPYAPHPATSRLLSERGRTREQLNYSVPADLELKRRMNAYNLANGSEGPGSVVAGLIDAFLRAQGFPPDPKRVSDDR